MKRQMKMTTTQKPQKKFLGGKIMKKLAPKVSEVVKKAGESVKKTAESASPAAAAVSSGGGRGFLGRLVSGAKKAIEKAPAVTAAGAAAPAVAEEAKKRMSGLRGIGRALRGRGRALSKMSGMMGMKKGGSVMADKMGRAMKKKTADARGRAMKGK